MEERFKHRQTAEMSIRIRPVFVPSRKHLVYTDVHCLVQKGEGIVSSLLIWAGQVRDTRQAQIEFPALHMASHILHSEKNKDCEDCYRNTIDTFTAPAFGYCDHSSHSHMKSYLVLLPNIVVLRRFRLRHLEHDVLSLQSDSILNTFKTRFYSQDLPQFSWVPAEEARRGVNWDPCYLKCGLGKRSEEFMKHRRSWAFGISVHPDSDCTGRPVLGPKFGLGLPVRSKSTGLDRCPLGGLKHSFHVGQLERCFRYSPIDGVGVVQAFVFFSHLTIPWPLEEFVMISDIDYIVSIVMKDSFASLAVVQDVLKSKSFMISVQHAQIHSVFSLSYHMWDLLLFHWIYCCFSGNLPFWIVNKKQNCAFDDTRTICTG